MSRRAALSLVLLASLLAFGIAFVVLLSSFIIPGKEWVRVGPAAGFPVRSTPYLLDSPRAFIVHREGTWLAFSGRPPNPRFQETCWLEWDLERERITEPCGGAFFALDGRYLGGPFPRDMDRYALEIRGEEIWLETTRLFTGKLVPTAEAGTPVPVTPP